jgi:hypothetical protein
MDILINRVRGSSQATQQKDAAETELAPPVHVQVPDYRNRHRQNGDISQKRQRPIHRATNSLILARSAMDALVVVKRHGRAHGEVDNPGGNTPGHGVCHVCVGKVLELLVGEESDVEEEDGEFSADQSGLICSLQGKSYLKLED